MAWAGGEAADATHERLARLLACVRTLTEARMRGWRRRLRLGSTALLVLLGVTACAPAAAPQASGSGASAGAAPAAAGAAARGLHRARGRLPAALGGPRGGPVSEARPRHRAGGDGGRRAGGAGAP